MTDATILELEGHLKKHIIKTVISSVVSACLLAVGIGVAFYYNTNFSIETLNRATEEHAEQIGALNDNMQKLTNALTKSGTPLEVHSVQIQNLERQMTEMKSDVKDVNAKLDILLTRK
jgi:uncharacterized protein HemX